MHNKNIARGRPKLESGHRVRLNLTIDPAVRDRLFRAAKREGKSQARIVEDAISEKLDKLEDITNEKPDV